MRHELQLSRQSLRRFAGISVSFVMGGIGAQDAGVAIVPLKGAALHANGLYLAGDRPMADIDLLAGEFDIHTDAPADSHAHGGWFGELMAHGPGALGWGLGAVLVAAVGVVWWRRRQRERQL